MLEAVGLRLQFHEFVPGNPHLFLLYIIDFIFIQVRKESCQKHLQQRISLISQLSA